MKFNERRSYENILRGQRIPDTLHSGQFIQSVMTFSRRTANAGHFAGDSYKWSFLNTAQPPGLFTHVYPADVIIRP